MKILLMILVAIGFNACATRYPAATSKDINVKVSRINSSAISYELLNNSIEKKELKFSHKILGFDDKYRIHVNRIKKYGYATKEVSCRREWTDFSQCGYPAKWGCQQYKIDYSCIDGKKTIEYNKPYWRCQDYNITKIASDPLKARSKFLYKINREDAVKLKFNSDKATLTAQDGYMFLNKSLEKHSKNKKLDNIFGLYAKDVKIFPIVLSVENTTETSELFDNISRKLKYFCSNYKNFAEEMKESMLSNSQTNTVSENFIFQMVDFRSLPEIVKNDALSSFHPVKITAIDSLNHLPIEGVDIKIHGLKKVILNRDYIVNKYLKKLNSLVFNCINKRLPTNWFTNFNDDNIKNGTTYNLIKRRTKLNIEAIHKDYVYTSGDITIMPTSKEIVITMDRIGVVQRSAQSLKNKQIEVK